MNLATMRTRVRNAVKDIDASAYYWSNDEVDAAIVAALGEFTLACPDCSSSLQSPNGSSRTFDLSAVSGFLYALAVEYPIDEEPPKYVGFREYVQGVVIVRGDVPAAGNNTLRVWYAKAYDSGAATWTLAAEDEQSIEVGAAANLCESGARYSSGRINAAVGTPDQLGKRAWSFKQDWQQRIAAARRRQVGPQWWTSWRVDERDV